MPELQCPSPPPIVPRPTALDVRSRTRRTQLNWQTVIIGLLVAGILVLCIYLAVTHLPAGSLRLKPVPADFPTEKELAVFIGHKLGAEHVQARSRGYTIRFARMNVESLAQLPEAMQHNEPLLVSRPKSLPEPGYSAGVVFGPYLFLGSF